MRASTKAVWLSLAKNATATATMINGATASPAFAHNNDAIMTEESGSRRTDDAGGARLGA